MTLFQAMVLGVVQGLAEFLPISSSAHLALTPWLLGWTDPGLAFDVALHVGTLIALAWYFRREWAELASAAWSIARSRSVKTELEWRLVYLVIATIPAAIVGVLVADLAEAKLRAPSLIATALVLMGAGLWAADRFSRSDRSLGEMRWYHALGVGIAQSFALIPGVSRSGSTITSARLLRFSRRDAAVFSFLMSFPITTAAAVFKVPEALREGVTATLVVGVVSAAISSAAAISILLRYVTRRSYAAFALYRFLFAGLIFGLLAARNG